MSSSLRTATPSTAAPPTEPIARASIDNIQVLRAFAVLLVAFVHLDVFLRALGLAPFGHGGVDLFFVISGFIMVYTTRGRPVTAASFMRNRITRIAPIYWLITLAVYAVALILPSLLQATSADPIQLVKSLAFIPFQKANGLVQPVLFVGWTLNYEMFFYALFALGLMFADRQRGTQVVIALLVLLVVAGLVFQPQGALAAFYTRSILLEFGAGMALGALGTRAVSRGRAARTALLATCGLGLVATAVVPLLLPEWPRVISHGIPAALVVTSAILLHEAGVALTMGPRSQRLLLLLGNASYSIYLTHPFVTQAAQKLGKRFGTSPVLVVAFIIATLVLVCAVGIVTHLFVEKPLTRLAKSLAERRVASEPPPEPAPQYARVD